MYNITNPVIENPVIENPIIEFYYGVYYEESCLKVI